METNGYYHNIIKAINSGKDDDEIVNASAYSGRTERETERLVEQLHYLRANPLVAGKLEEEYEVLHKRRNEKVSAGRYEV